MCGTCNFLLASPQVVGSRPEVALPSDHGIRAVPLKKDVPLQITPQDLLNVKLKKTQSEPTMDKEMSPSKGRKALITLKDLQSIRLQSKAPQPLPRITSLFNPPSRDGLDFRKHLKKVAIKRSPGGTPMINKENTETGTGLTPIMTQALRRKFQARPSRNVYCSHCSCRFPGKMDKSVHKNEEELFF
ncbi:proline-rich protein 11-like [Candoia aspera]|uniref:proline-rich protein 11-like n=1 Tax=Candoia aspera TaxID=51853 RepID=UPI002FD7B855